MKQIVLDRNTKNGHDRNTKFRIFFNANDVKIKMTTIGVCGSDIHYYAEGKIGTQVVQYPFPVGHECSGIIEEIGEHVSNVKVGDLVVVDPSVHCGDMRSMFGRKTTHLQK